jgi:hypothetical protein
LIAQVAVAERAAQQLQACGYVYRFIELCSPALTEAVVRKAL